MNLTQKTAKGFLWTGSSTAAGTLLNFVILAFLARLLSPSDFGLMGMVMVVLNFAAMIADLGLGSAIIQDQNITRDQISTFFFINIILGIFICIIIYSFSETIAVIFKNAELSNLLKVISFSFVAISLGQTFRTLLRKWMDFRKLALVEISGIFFYGSSSIYFAASGFGVWSLVYGFLIRQVSETIILFVITDFRPKLVFNLKSIKRLLNFGLFIFGGRVTNYFNRNLDYMIIGYFLGAEALGFYTLAYRLMLLPLRKVSLVISRVMFPAFSKVQNANDKIRDGYLKIVKYISLVTFPLMTGLFVVAPEFVNVVYGAKWKPAILILQILCLIGAVQSIGTTVGIVQNAKGRPDIGFKWNCFAVCCNASAFLIGVNWGVIGVASAYALVSIILFPIIQVITNRLIELKWKDFSRQFINQIFGSLLLFICVLVFKIYMLNEIVASQTSILISSILLGGFVYITFIFLKEKKSIIRDIKIFSVR